MIFRLPMFALLLCLTAAPVHAQRFFPDDPLAEDPDRIAAPSPKEVEDSDVYDFLLNTFGSPVGYDGPALNVNTLGEVPNSSWYTNRHYFYPMTTEEVVRGPNTVDGPSMEGKWKVVDAKSEGVSLGMQIIDGRGDRYLLKFDHQDFPEMSSGAEVIVTRLYHALGYHVPENFIVRFSPEQLIPDPEATIEVDDEEVPLTDVYIQNVLASTYRYPDGTVRAMASKFLSGSPLGPITYAGTRPDDANDIYPHEGRRELRGLRVFAAWVGHFDARRANSLDMFIDEDDDGMGYVRHHLIDFGSTLGGGPGGPKGRWMDHEYIVEGDRIFVRALTFGFLGSSWINYEYPDVPPLGRFDADHFEPDEWRPQYPNPAFQQMDAADAFWAARQAMAITDEQVRALVEAAEYMNPAATDYMTDVLIQRRDKIGDAYLRYAGGLDHFRVEAGRLVFEDLPAKHGLEPAGRTRMVTWHPFDNVSGQPGEIIATTETGETALALPPTEAPFLMVDLRTTGQGLTRVFLRRGGAVYEVVGVERDGA